MRVCAPLFALMLGFCLAFAPAARAAAPESMIAKAKKRGELRVGFSTFVPWAMQDKNGEFIGFEIDVATRLAKDLGVKPVFFPTKWAGIIPALLTDQFDIIIAGMSVTDERKAKVDFTEPYDYAGMDMVANKAKAAGFATLADFNKKGVTLAARTGGSAKGAIDANFPNATVRYFDEEAQALQEVLSGKAHAFVSSAPLPAMQVARHPDVLFRPLQEPFTKEPIGFALRQGDAESLGILNAWIAQAHANGFLKERKHYWFETIAWEKDLK